MARTYTVVAGDTLSAIALRFYGDADLFPLIATANGIADPNAILDGQVLTIPDPGNQTIPDPGAGQTIPDPPSQSQLFVRDLSFGFGGRDPFFATADNSFFKVPPGKRLVSEDISIAAAMGKGQKLFVNLVVVDVDRNKRRLHGMPVVFQMTNAPHTAASESEHYAGGRPLRIVLEPGEILTAEAGRDSATSDAFVQIFVYGHFMDVRTH